MARIGPILQEGDATPGNVLVFERDNVAKDGGIGVVGLPGGLVSISGVADVSASGPGGVLFPLALKGSDVEVLVAGVERGRFTSSGYFKASDNGTYFNAAGGMHELRQNSTGFIALFTHTHAAPGGGVNVMFTNAAPNDTTTFFQVYQDNAAFRAAIYSNGGLGNYQTNNVNYSDASLKSDVVLYDDAELDALEASFCNVQWGKWHYNDQSHDDWNHGYIAQDVAQAFADSAPELVDDALIAMKEGDPVTKKVVYDSDLTHIALALLARALKRIGQLEAKLSPP